MLGVRFSRRAAGRRNNVDVAARGSLVAHQAFDEGDVLAVGRDMGLGNLPFGSVNLTHLTGLRIDAIELCDIPICIAGAVGGGCDPALAVGSPIVFIDVDIGRRDLCQRVRRKIDRRQALLVHFVIDHACERGHGLERPGDPRHAFDEQQSEF